jgi:hypothetical protein
MKNKIFKFLSTFSVLASVVLGAELTLSWTDNSNNETGFIIERVLGTGANPAFTKVGEVGANVTTYVDKNLPNNTTYTYRVKAFNEGGQSAPSNTATGTTVVAPPAAPSNVTITKVVIPPNP